MEISINAAVTAFNRFKLLNGYDKVVEIDGASKTIFIPFQFNSSTCWNIAKNINVLRKVTADYEDAQKLLVASMGVDDNTYTTDPEKYKKFVAELNTLLSKKVEVNGVLKIKLSGLNLDKNPIQPGLLADLADYIDGEN
jgi:hypothetical protein